MTPPAAVLNAVRWLYEWQTLVSGLLALGAAWAASYVSRQIAQTDRLHQEEVGRRHNSARVILPLALAAITQFLQTMADHVADEIELHNQPDRNDDGRSPEVAPAARTRFDPVELPLDYLRALKDFTETLVEPTNLRHVAELVSHIQIVSSRYGSFNFEQVSVSDHFHELLMNIAIPGALTNSMFNYARFVDGTDFGIVGTISNEEAWKIIGKRLYGFVFVRPRLDLFAVEADRRIRQHVDRGDSPWLRAFSDE